MAPEAQKLIDIVTRIVDERREETRISPSWVATEAMLVIDPRRTAPPLVHLGCHLELRQLARSILREWFEGEQEDHDSAQHELFPNLQRRYPVQRTRGDEPEYVRLEDMSIADLRFNVGRLRREAHAKLAHADALEAFGRSRAA
jgi:hypothetical protein